MRLCDPETSASPLFASLSFSVCTERKESESASHSVVSRSLRPRGLYSPWDSPTQNTGVGSLCLLQGIFPTQGSNHKGSPRILEWVAYPFSSGSSWPRNRTGVSCITGTFFTNWAMREAPCFYYRLAFRTLGPFWIAEGNGNPLQCSCLENPRDGGAWWATVCGVAQSWTRLKRLSSSGSMGLKEKRVSEDEMTGWHHRCNGHELGQTLGDVRGRPGMPKSRMGLRRVGHDWATENGFEMQQAPHLL